MKKIVVEFWHNFLTYFAFYGILISKVKNITVRGYEPSRAKKKKEDAYETKTSF